MKSTPPSWPVAARFIPSASATILCVACLGAAGDASPEFQLTPQDALETHGLCIFFFQNSCHPAFGDEKMSGLEIILHKHRIATIIQPDFPELMSDWPFLWYENEYVVDTATAFILAANAANPVASEPVEKTLMIKNYVPVRPWM
jgi:hypothetical protein